MTEREEIGAEITRWLAHDRMYCYTLAMYAKQQGHITEAELLTLKTDLDAYYENTEYKGIKKNEYLYSIFQRAGFGPTKVLWRLIDQFPTRVYGNIENCEFIPFNETIYKALKVSTKVYYATIAKLISFGYLSKRIADGKLVYRIHFDRIKDDALEQVALGNEGKNQDGNKSKAQEA